MQYINIKNQLQNLSRISVPPEFEENGGSRSPADLKKKRKVDDCQPGCQLLVVVGTTHTHTQKDRNSKHTRANTSSFSMVETERVIESVGQEKNTCSFCMGELAERGESEGWMDGERAGGRGKEGRKAGRAGAMDGMERDRELGGRSRVGCLQPTSPAHSLSLSLPQPATGDSMETRGRFPSQRKVGCQAARID